MLEDCLRRVGEGFEVLSGFLLETEDPENLGSPRSPLRAGDEGRGGICEATTSLEPDGAGAKAVTEWVENTELEGPAIDSPGGSQQLAAPLGGGELDRAGPRQSRRPIAELRSNCAERSRGSEVHKAEARAPSGLLPPAGGRRGLGRHPSA